MFDILNQVEGLKLYDTLIMDLKHQRMLGIQKTNLWLTSFTNDPIRTFRIISELIKKIFQVICLQN